MTIPTIALVVRGGDDTPDKDAGLFINGNLVQVADVDSPSHRKLESLMHLMEMRFGDKAEHFHITADLWDWNGISTKFIPSLDDQEELSGDELLEMYAAEQEDHPVEAELNGIAGSLKEKMMRFCHSCTSALTAENKAPGSSGEKAEKGLAGSAGIGLAVIAMNQFLEDRKNCLADYVDGCNSAFSNNPELLDTLFSASAMGVKGVIGAGAGFAAILTGIGAHRKMVEVSVPYQQFDLDRIENAAHKQIRKQDVSETMDLPPEAISEIYARVRLSYKDPHEATMMMDAVLAKVDVNQEAHPNALKMAGDSNSKNTTQENQEENHGFTPTRQQ